MALIPANPIRRDDPHEIENLALPVRYQKYLLFFMADIPDELTHVAFYRRAQQVILKTLPQDHDRELVQQINRLLLRDIAETCDQGPDFHNQVKARQRELADHFGFKGNLNDINTFLIADEPMNKAPARPAAAETAMQPHQQPTDSTPTTSNVQEHRAPRKIVRPRPKEITDTVHTVRDNAPIVQNEPEPAAVREPHLLRVKKRVRVAAKKQADRTAPQMLRTFSNSQDTPAPTQSPLIPKTHEQLPTREDLEATAEVLLTKHPAKKVKSSKKAKVKCKQSNDDSSLDDMIDKLPLTRPVIPSALYPVDALGPILGPAALAIHDKTQAPLPICCQSVLAAATLCTQGFADAVTPFYRCPVSGFYLSIGGSGERKTAVEAIANLPIRERETSLRARYREELAQYQVDLEMHKLDKREIMKIDDRNQRLVELKKLGPEPEPPLRPNLTLEDPTPEGSIRFAKEGQPSFGIFSDEGARMLEGYGMSRENANKTAAFLSQLWAGNPIELTRAKHGDYQIECVRVATHLLTQESVAINFLGNENFERQGLLSRFNAVYPASTVGTRMTRELAAGTEANIGKYRQRLKAILETPLPLVEGTRNVLNPRELPLSPEAVDVFVAYHDEIEAGLAEDGKYASHRGFGNKSPENAVRMAGVLTLVEDLNAPSISAEKMTAGVTLARYYLNEVVRISTSAIIDRDLILAEKLLAWAIKRGGTFAMVDVYQVGPVPIRKKAAAKAIIAILLDHNQIRQIRDGAEIDGQYRREVYEVV